MANPEDLILKPKSGYSTTEGLRPYESLSDRLQSKGDKLPILFKHDSASRTGDHAPYDVFFAYGKNIKSGYTVQNISVMDILPQALIVMNIPLPSRIDGKVHEEIFIEKPEVKIAAMTDEQILSEGERKKIEALRNKLKRDLTT